MKLHSNQISLLSLLLDYGTTFDEVLTVGLYSITHHRGGVSANGGFLFYTIWFPVRFPFPP